MNTLNQPTDHRSWLWLVVGAALLPFASLHPGLPLAAWLAPIFLLHFTRTQRARRGLPLVLLVASAAALIPWGALDFPPLVIGSAIGYGLILTLGYLVDRLLSPRLDGFARTLVFPLAVTTVDFLMLLFGTATSQNVLVSLVGPATIWGSPAYTQAGILPLVQLVSITGLWGVTFLIAWCAAVANEVWANGHTWRVLRYSILPFATVLGAVILFGSVRLAFFPAPAPSVRVAGMAPRADLFRTILDMHPGDLMPGTSAQRAGARARFTPVVDDLFARTEQAARSGAKIVLWSETAAPILKEDDSTVIERARTLARKDGIYLQIGIVVFRRTNQFPFMENRAILVDPTGTVIWDYNKAHPTPGENTSVAAGPSVVPTVDTPYGRLATVLCYDADFPTLVRQAGQARVDVLLVPNKEWNAVKFQHARMHTFRAIENGVTVVRATGDGLSTIVDVHGHVLASVDSFATNAPLLAATIATKATPTIYARIGDSFAYLCMAGLVVLTGLALMRRGGVAVAVPQLA